MKAIASVLGGQDGLAVDLIEGPFDAEATVHGVQAVLTPGRVPGRAQVQHRRVVGEGHEPVPEALHEEQRLAFLVVKADRVPGTEAL